MVYKDSPKKVRLFYRCPKGPTSTCHFFKWVDKDDNQIPENAKKPKLIRRKRKCGICGIEGNNEEESLKNSFFCYFFFSLQFRPKLLPKVKTNTHYMSILTETITLFYKY